MTTLRTRMTALIVALAVVLSLIPAGGALAESTGGLNIPFGGNVAGYDPSRDGYYGLLPVRYDASKAADGSKIMKNVHLPVLVKDGHVFISSSEAVSVLGLSTKRDSKGILLSAFERKLGLTYGSREANYFAGDPITSYFSLPVTLNAAPFQYGGVVWLPFQELCVLFDLGLHVETNGTESFVTLYQPTENVVDVLSYLYSHSADCQTAYTSDNLAVLGATSAAAQLAAKMLDGSGVAWSAVALSAIGMDEKAYELLIEELARDLTNALLCVIPDETALVNHMANDRVSALFPLIGSADYDSAKNDLSDASAVTGNVANFAEKTILEGFVQKFGQMAGDAAEQAAYLIDPSSGLNDPKQYAALLERAKELAEQSQGIKDYQNAVKSFSTDLDIASAGLTTGLSLLQSLSIYESVEELSRMGVDILWINKGGMTRSDPTVLDEIERHSLMLQEEWAEYSVYHFALNDLGSIVSGLVTSSCPAFQIFPLVAHLTPFTANGIDATHSFQVSSLSIPLQYDMETVLKNYLNEYPIRNAGVGEIDTLIETAYMYLKICYVSRNMAISALELSGNELTEKYEMMDFLLNKMAILSADYGQPHENIYSKVYRMVALNDGPMIDLVEKMYLEVSGEVLKEEDNTPVFDAHCEIYNGNDEYVGFFDGTPGGSYTAVCLPVYKPSGVLPYDPGRTIAARMSFTSPTVNGEDTVRAEGEPESFINPVDTAYLEDESTAYPPLYITTDSFNEEGPGYNIDITRPVVWSEANAELMAIVDAALEPIYSKVFERAERTRANADPTQKQPQREYANPSNAYSNGVLLHLAITSGYFDIGIGHNCTTTDYFIFDVFTGEQLELELEDLFNPENPAAKEQFIDLLDQYIVPIENFSMPVAGVSKLYSSLQENKYMANWNLQINGLRVSVDHLSMGFRGFTIPYEELQDIFAPEYIVIEQMGGASVEKRSPDSAIPENGRRLVSTPEVSAVYADGLATQLWVRTISEGQEEWKVDGYFDMFYAYGAKNALITLPESSYGAYGVTWINKEGAQQSNIGQ